MNTTDGAFLLATSNSARTIFSLSPTYLEVRDEAEIEKNVAFDSEATAYEWIVLWRIYFG